MVKVVERTSDPSHQILRTAVYIRPTRPRGLSRSRWEILTRKLHTPFLNSQAFCFGFSLHSADCMLPDAALEEQGSRSQPRILQIAALKSLSRLMKPSSAKRGLQSDFLVDAEVQVKSAHPPETWCFRNYSLAKSLCDLVRILTA